MDYTKEYIRKNPGLHIEDSEFKAAEILHILPSNITVNSLLDVACGAGKISLILGSKLSIEKIVGIDISKTIIEKARELDTKHEVTWKVTDIFSYRPKSIFDLIICIDIVEHIKNDYKFLQKLGDLGNRVVVKAPIEDSLFYKFLKKAKIFDGWKFTENKFGHLHHYGEGSLDKLISRAGWKIVRSSTAYVPKRPKLKWKIIGTITYPLRVFDNKHILRLFGGYKMYYLEKK
ncbi:hypothetical protein COW99_05950 [Candidatus Roizmanbacteria bacterium CG22_combo_CG10-13_8_21_14_all_38_20]|uniref:Methyltransferase domain-containing protein n=1 Tax=Candidatus Roizmanbacteria bacterium CG22_combo_CG10-13_8_21_14_all_38_20 TaxID=1974862 RepID=A0A2H0BTW8_9BACT|nr:MAG: hypothetical protein COW99_05950 [Candidatus Roizmanbacteria bacterium CG22_combo_CG10-13_8_21_14_all_38_20]PJC32237.1 MAG: hypothetical protein CO050_00670 [Candidatus Roizmanbacteria bacterium CG_4_9_14_0_2_um_filter_38_17]